MVTPTGESSVGRQQLKGHLLPAVVVLSPERNKAGTNKRDVGVYFLGIQRIRGKKICQKKKKKNVPSKKFRGQGGSSGLIYLIFRTKFCNMRKSLTRRAFWSQVYPEENVFST